MVAAASYPPLQRTQERGTHSSGTRIKNRKDGPPAQAESQSVPGKVDGIDVNWSGDGKWVAYRTRGNKFVLADSSGKTQHVLFDGKQVVTPLRWSPDDEFLTYVKKGAKWEPINPMKCLDDVEDVMVYRVQDGQQGRVYQVCAGYPYWELHWLKVPANLPL